MTFAIMITTHNRCADLRRTCAALTSLSPPPDEVLICADGCTDGTLSMVRREFPGFVVLENDKRQGSVASRDRMLRLATSDVVISLDDDSYPIDRDFLTRLRNVLEHHPEAAVISFAAIREQDCRGRAAPSRDECRGRYVAAYANCGAAMRREVYLKVSGFPTFFGHMYEEADYALQCYAAGFAVWFEPDLVVRHHIPPCRSRSTPAFAPACACRSATTRTATRPSWSSAAACARRCWRTPRTAATGRARTSITGRRATGRASSCPTATPACTIGSRGPRCLSSTSPTILRNRTFGPRNASRTRVCCRCSTACVLITPAGPTRNASLPMR
jgi:Glycosyl transferase family 2